LSRTDSVEDEEVFADVQERMEEEEEVFADVDVQELIEMEEEVLVVELEEVVVEEFDLDGQKMEEQMERLGWIQLQSVADQAGDQAVAEAAT